MENGESGGRTFVSTPTWVIALVCFFIVSISFIAERGLHKLGKCFKRKNQEALYDALQKLKEELMLLGFISLMLTVSPGLISNMCIPNHLANIMLPCQMGNHRAPEHGRRLLAEHARQQCSDGHSPFLSLEAVHQLHIFIFVLALVYVFFSASTMVLGGIRIREWNHWEHSIRTDISALHRVHTHHAHLQEFIGRTGTYWRKFRVISWMAAFFKQFYGSVTRSDYVALRSGFIREHCPSKPDYNFHAYILRTLEKDFKKIIGISSYLWLFVVIFLLMNIAGWHAYFWMSFLPLILLLVVGAKLEHIITELAKDAEERSGDAEGTQVRLSDELFWFDRPALVLYLIHFILFQNSFEIAFFFWIWTTYGFRSCIMEELGFIIPKLIIGVIVQVLCSYSTLPLYALVSQMGSMFKQTIFDEFTRDLIRSWASKPKDSSKDSSVANGSKGKLNSEPPTGGSKQTEIELSRPNRSNMPSSSQNK